MTGANGTPEAIRRLLGVEPGADPATILGLPGAGVGPTAILNALNARLGQVSAHPEGMTSAGDAARDVLHEAASALLAAEWAAPLAKRVEPEAPASPDEWASQTHGELVRDAMLTLAQFGGWNRASMRRMGLLARRRGVDPSRVAALVVEAARRRMGNPDGGVSALASAGPPMARVGGDPAAQRPVRTGGAGQTSGGVEQVARTAAPAAAVGSVAGGRTLPPIVSPPRPGSSIFVDPAPEPEREDAGQRMVKVVLLVFGGVMALLLAAGVVITLVVAPPAGKGNASDVESGGVSEIAPPPEVVETPRPKVKVAAASELAQAEPGAVIRAISTAVEALDLDAGVAEESFVEAVGGAARAWPRMAPDQIAAMQEQVVEFVYRAAGAGRVSEHAVEASLVHLAGLTPESPARADGVVPALFSAGIAARLMAERDMPAIAQVALRRALPPGGTVSLSPGSFASGALAAGTALAAQFAQRAPIDDAAWHAWNAAIDALVRNDEAMASRVRLLALDAVLAGPPSSFNDPALGKVAAMLVKGISWRDGDESRRWLVRWLESPRASSAGLAAVVDALIDQSSAAGMDMTMRLAPAASVSQRSDLRERIARQWGVADGADRGETYKAWAAASERVLGQTEATPLRRLAHALTLSRLSEAAELQAGGDPTAAATVLGDLEAPATKALATAARTESDTAPPMEDWLVRYAAAEKSVPARVTLLGELRGERLPPAVMETVLGEALRSAAVPVREAAREVVRRRIITPEAAMALLDALPNMARTRDNAELVTLAVTDTLPPARDAGWKLAARRALVSRLLDLLSTDQESAAAEALALELAGSYATRTAGVSVGGTPADRSLPDLAGLLRGRWRERAIATAAGGPQPALIAELDARYESRRSLARGIVQRFAADQASAAEMMGATVRAEHPASAEAVDQILADLAAARRQAGSAFEQIEACEAAMLRLWRVRLSGGAA
jgi:hypothetical protein